jgi:TonB family protein
MYRKLSYLSFLLILAGILCSNTSYGQVDTLYSADGSVLEIGELVDGFKNGHWASYYPDGKIRSEGLFKHGYRVGEWTWYHENGAICSIEKWKKGLYKKGDYWDANGNQSDISEVLTNPEYPGGIEAFTRMISEKIQYPEEAIDKGLEGRVVLKFRINSRGELVNPVVAEPAHPKLNKEALRVVQLSDLWIPAEFHGMKTTTSYTFPISFALQE